MPMCLKPSIRPSTAGERHDRARALASRIGATATQVALAWLLHRPFPTWAVVGARSVAEVEESAAAAQLRIGPSELGSLYAGD